VLNQFKSNCFTGEKENGLAGEHGEQSGERGEKIAGLLGRRRGKKGMTVGNSHGRLRNGPEKGGGRQNAGGVFAREHGESE